MQLRNLFLCLLLALMGACSSDSVDDALDLIEGVDRKPIDTNRMGVNAFSNQSFAGSTCEQLDEIKNTLRLNFVRILFNWDDNVQSSPGDALNFSFYDSILSCIPAGVDALVILTNVPSWMSDESNWISNNPRLTFVQNWVQPVLQRYKGNSSIIGYQIWNEPNNLSFPENDVLDLTSQPVNFVELVSFAYDVVKSIDPSKLVINGSTTSIAQNFPNSLNYNRDLYITGIENVIDRFGIHYYGNNFENLVSEVDDFLNQIIPPIWVTESGKQGVNEQLPFVETVWPFLRERVPNIDRIYYYRFAEATPSDSTFGLRNPDPAFPVSDLYSFLRDR